MKRCVLTIAGTSLFIALPLGIVFAEHPTTGLGGRFDVDGPIMRLADSQILIQRSGNSSAVIGQQGGNSTATIMQNGKTVTMQNGKVVEGGKLQSEDKGVVRDCAADPDSDSEEPCRTIDPTPGAEAKVPRDEPLARDEKQSEAEKDFKQDFGIILNTSPEFRRLFLDRFN